MLPGVAIRRQSTPDSPPRERTLHGRLSTALATSEEQAGHALDTGLPFIFSAFRPKAAAASKAVSPVGHPPGGITVSKWGPSGCAVRRDAGRGLFGLRTPDRCVSPPARGPVRGQLQLPEQDVPRAHASGRLRDD